MATAADTHTALVVGLARHLGAVLDRARSEISGESPPWTIWAQGFDHDDFVALAGDVIAYIGDPAVIPQFAVFAASRLVEGADVARQALANVRCELEDGADR